MGSWASIPTRSILYDPAWHACIHAAWHPWDNDACHKPRWHAFALDIYPQNLPQLIASKGGLTQRMLYLRARALLRLSTLPANSKLCFRVSSATGATKAVAAP